MTSHPALAHDGVSDGARTRDNRDHNPVLYQLSYAHHARVKCYREPFGAVKTVWR